MNEEIVKSLLVEIAEQEVPAGTDLWPEIRRELQFSKPSTGGKTISRPQLVVGAGLAAGVVLLVVFLFTPQGRTFAQQVAEFFARVQGRTQPVPEGGGQHITPAPIHYLEIVPVDPQTTSQTYTTLPAYPGCEDPAVTQTYRCQMAAAELMAGFDAKELPSDPAGLAFEMVDVDPTNKSIAINYTNGNPSNISWLTLAQGQGNFPAEKFGRVPADGGEAVLVAGSPGEYVSGAFIYRLGSDQSTWLSDPGVAQRLAWRAGNRWFVIGEAINTGQPGYMDKQALITLAESLVDAAPLSEQEKLRPEHLHTLAEAEILAGFNLKAPSKLPANFAFYNAQFVSQLSQVRLTYFSPAVGSWLTIIETPEKKFNLQKFISGHSSAEKVKINDKDGWYIDRDAKSPTPIFLEDDAQEGLYWQEESIVYRILFSPSSESGDRLGKSGIVEIGNNLVFPGK